MVAIPPRRDPVLDAIDAILEKESEEASKLRDRASIPAGMIGGNCSRKLWYRYHLNMRETFSADTIRKFNDGHRCEDIMAGLLRKVPGIELYTHKEDGSQYGFEDGPFKGNYDGVIGGLPMSSRWHVWENKATNEKKFEELKKLKAINEKTALRNWDRIYYAQAVIYMEYEGLERHYMTVCTPGLRDYTSVRTEADPAFAAALKAKAHRIANAKEPPERIGGPDYFECKWCFFHGVCHNDAT